MDRWERRAKKLDAKRQKMHISGRGLLTIVEKASKAPRKKRRRSR
ncbi:MAG: hypothetical protein ABIP13_11315 [Tepidiformaceae bacterium]